MFTIHTFRKTLHAEGAVSHLEIPMPPRGILTRFVLEQTDGTVVAPMVDLFEAKSAVELGSSSGGNPTEVNADETTPAYDPDLYKIFPTKTGTIVDGVGRIQWFAADVGAQGYTFDLVDENVPATGTPGQGTNKRRGWLRLTLAGVAAPPNHRSSWNLCLQYLLDK